MDDLISRQAAIDFINAGHLVNPNEPRWSDNEVVNFLKSRPSAEEESFEWCYTCKEYDQEKHCCHRWTKVIRNTVEELQSAQRTGRWIFETLDGTPGYRPTVMFCSKCGRVSIADYSYCPNCGARMQEDDNG